jgi:integrase
MKLNDVFLRNLKAEDKPRKYFDGHGLYLHVSPTGGKLWRMSYRHNGKDKVLSFGAYPYVSLRDAREQRDEAKTLLAKGIDPGALKRQSRLDRVTFEVWGARWLELHASRTAPKTQEKNTYLVNILNKKIGALTLPELDRKTLVSVVQGIQNAKGVHLAHRTASILANVVGHAYDSGQTRENHAVGLAKVLMPYKATHRAALVNPAELGALLRKIWAYEGAGLSVGYCLKILPYLALRSEEIRGARWTELDLDAARWTIPATRHAHGGGMKMRIAHTVPLPLQVVSLFRELKEWQAMLGGFDLCFPSPRDAKRPVSAEGLLVALKVVRGAADISVHGFRTSFSTLARELGFDHHHIEKALAHGLENKVQAAYDRAEYLEPRRELMQAWADYLDELRQGKD